MENDDRKKRKKRLGILGRMMIGKGKLHTYTPGGDVQVEAKTTSSQFVIIKHEAKRAGLHYDLRFKLPTSAMWMSFAVRKGVPLKPGKKVLAVRTHDHTRKEALFTGTIKGNEYGAGKLSKFDGGSCTILKFGTGAISIDFKGSKVKGIYHLINTGVINKQYKRQQFMLFKGKAA